MPKWPIWIVTLLAAASCASPLSSEAGGAGIDVSIVFTPVGDGSGFSARVGGDTFTLPGAAAVTLAPDSYTMTGTFHGRALSVTFLSLSQQGGVQTGSVKSQSGPASQVNACTVTYSNDTPDVERSFEIAFSVDTTAAGACGGPAV